MKRTVEENTGLDMSWMLYKLARMSIYLPPLELNKYKEDLVEIREYINALLHKGNKPGTT